MKAAFLIKHGQAKTAFEIRDIKLPPIKNGEVLIKVEGFGLNFADVMARLGLYPAAPSLPGIVGYDVVGTVQEKGSSVTDLAIGDRVTAMTRFGGYATHAIAPQLSVAKISKDMPVGVAAALTTQYCTAYHMAEEMVRLFPGDRVLIHAAAGGVGTALVQIALHRKCIVYGTAGSPEKIEKLKNAGVHHPINYRETDFHESIKQSNSGVGLDAIFDPIGGKSVKKGMQLLGAGGRMVVFGASSLTNSTNIIGKMKVLFGFGLYHPIKLLGPSKALIGVNMLQIADKRPDKLSRALGQVVKWTEAGILTPQVGGTYSIDQLAEAHHKLEHRETTGKLVICW